MVLCSGKQFDSFCQNEKQPTHDPAFDAREFIQEKSKLTFTQSAEHKSFSSLICKNLGPERTQTSFSEQTAKDLLSLDAW